MHHRFEKGATTGFRCDEGSLERNDPTVDAFDRNPTHPVNRNDAILSETKVRCSAFHA
jgi:hypothetical protein